jgi:hypothetical protein
MAARVKSFRISKQLLYFHRKSGRERLRGGILRNMNVRPELKDAALLQRMTFWLLRARHGPLGNCSKSRGKKNYLSLVRRHRALAEQHGLRETDIY